MSLSKALSKPSTILFVEDIFWNVLHAHPFQRVHIVNGAKSSPAIAPESLCPSGIFSLNRLGYERSPNLPLLSKSIRVLYLGSTAGGLKTTLAMRRSPCTILHLCREDMRKSVSDIMIPKIGALTAVLYINHSEQRISVS